jgi:predicted RNase H-like nuclease (RuvC/YqgF family)
MNYMKAKAIKEMERRLEKVELDTKAYAGNLASLQGIRNSYKSEPKLSMKEIDELKKVEERIATLESTLHTQHCITSNLKDALDSVRNARVVLRVGTYKSSFGAFTVEVQGLTEDVVVLVEDELNDQFAIVNDFGLAFSEKLKEE